MLYMLRYATFGRSQHSSLRRRIFHCRDKFLVHVEEKDYTNWKLHASIYYLCCRQNTWVAVTTYVYCPRYRQRVQISACYRSGYRLIERPLHGGANLQVDGSSPERKDQGLDSMLMIDTGILPVCSTRRLLRIKTGLIYGIGHAGVHHL